MSRGLTLLEMLIALALILMLTVAVGRFAESYRSGRDFAIEEASRDREIDAMFGRMAKAFAAADASVGGVVGQQDGIVIAHRGSVLPAAGSSGSALDLLSDFSRYEFRIEGDIQEAFFSGSAQTEVSWVSSLSVVELRYHDGTNWLDSWKSTAGLPLAIECKIWIDFDPDPETFETAEGAVEADTPSIDKNDWPRPDRHRIFAPVDPIISAGGSL